MFHSLVPAETLKKYCDQRIYHFRHNDLRPSSSRKIWTSDTTRRIFEVKTMRINRRMNKYNPRNPNRRAVEKRVAVAEIKAH